MRKKYLDSLKILKKKIKLFFSYFKINKNIKKIDEYKKRKKIEKKLYKKSYTNEKKRNKYNIQLNLKFKVRNYLNIIILIIILLLLIVLIITKGNYFKIKNINIISPDGVSNTYILQKKINYIKNKLIFNIDESKIKENISNLEQNIIKIEINKKFPDTLNIKVYSSQIVFKTILKGKNYLIAKNGTLIPTKSNNSDNMEIIINNFNLENYPDYKQILDSKNLEKILFLKNKLTDNIVNLKIKKIIYYKIEKEIHFIINNNSRLIFDLVGNIKYLLKQLFVFNKEKINIINPGIIYIDNRISGKIFYCPLKEIHKCIRNINIIYSEKLKLSDYEKTNR